MRTPLTEAELAAALATLPAWSGDTRRISRSGALTPEIAAAADELDHHPVEQDGRLVLWTHVRGCVTELDVALARRIDELL